MDHDLRSLLTQWGLPNYIATFEANNISLDVLSMLNNELVSELIVPIGDRAKFLKNLENWKQITNNSADLEDASSTFVDVLNDSHKKIINISEYFDISSDTLIQESSTLEAKTKTSIDPDDTHHLINTSDTELEIGELQSRFLPLKDLLLKSNEGQGLLNLYENDGKLTNNGRRKLCNIIVKDLLNDDPAKRVDGCILLEKAQMIKDVFQKENISTYFIPYVNNNKLKLKRCAKGKLYDCLQNRRRDLREAKVIQQRNKNNISNITNETITTASSTNNDEEHEENILWLQNNAEPFHTTEQKWQTTTPYRLNEIKSGKLTIDAYMTKYCILKTPRGYEFLIKDFNTMYPDASNKLFENFAELKPKLFKFAISKSQQPEIKELLEQIQCLSSDSEKYEEESSILALMLLPLLIGNPTHKGKKCSWRPSKAEIRDGFISHVLRPMDLEDTINKRREKYSKLNLTFQPIVVMVGPSYRDIQKYYVIINGTYFVVSSILFAIDTCFKCYYSLHSNYPTESACIWNFIQKGVYKLSTEWDQNYSTVNAFATDLGIDLK